MGVAGSAAGRLKTFPETLAMAGVSGNMINMPITHNRSQQQQCGHAPRPATPRDR
jgi:hypothetical protein